MPPCPWPVARSLLRPILGGLACLMAALSLNAAQALAGDGLDLTVSGLIDPPNPRVLSIADLEALGVSKTVTATPWHDGPRSFEGVSLQALLDHVGAHGTVIVATALNDFQTEIPLEDASKWPVIVAYKEDGAPMSIRDKGPFFVVYPFDKDKDLWRETIYNRSIWQLKSLDIQ
ncbi:MAG: molybdopterin-dependent oxidoreductase [Rhodospirillum sp.]|nr:molybdopterin-dependent oxidoreductase [Rhodospirillum sp.]MCF8489363.1 molybdopterin-dependent oxidoreductase [Rhodospirillum sp.]MCF8500719.1 molybdopterin-dependent oxidoreductase [Rhodospirillum sp.]